MIKAIREAFDDFVIAARIKPAITAGIPLLLMVDSSGFGIKNEYFEKFFIKTCIFSMVAVYYNY